jgi:glyoxylate/hydroxypyruvate reductase A
MVLLVNSGGEKAVEDWRRCLAEFAPDLDVRWWHDPAIDPEAVRYVLVWEPEPGRIASFPNLRMICSSAAGVDHILRDPHLPTHLPLVRMANEDTAQRMGEYACLGALCLLRDMKRVVANQARVVWDHFGAPRSARETRAGVLGLGNLGRQAAIMLAGLGFETAGWSTSHKDIPGVASYAGAAEFDAFLARTDILVALLPETPATIGLLNAATLARLPDGAGIVNAGRGSLIVAADLIAALDSGRLAGAFLDVFETEPLPPADPLWTHPKVIVTPHNASFGSRRERARHVAAAIAAFERGDTPPFLYDPERGY